MSDMSVNKKHNSQVHENQQVHDAEKAKKPQNDQNTQSANSSHGASGKGWEDFSDSHKKVSAPGVESAAQLDEKKKNQEKLQAAEIQRHLEQQRLGIKA